MKIFAINTVLDKTNAPGRIMMSISDAAKKRGDNVMFAFGRGDTIPNIDCYRIGSILDVYGHALMSRIDDSAGFHSTKATTKLIEKLEEFSPDIVHIHNLHGYYVNVVLLMDWLKKVKIPIVWTLHDCWPFTGHCARFIHNNCEQWKVGCTKCDYSFDYPVSVKSHSARNYRIKMSAFLGHENLKLIAVSKWQQSQLAHSFLKGYETHVIHNGIDTTLFSPNHVENAQTVILGVASRWIDLKNLEFFTTLAKSHPHYKIIIAGETTLRQRLNSPSNMQFLGVVQYDCLPQLYNASTVYINSSREETFGMTTIEAMSCGVSVIVNATTAMSEIVNRGGVVVDIDNMNDVSSAIELVLKNKSQFGADARDNVLNNFSEAKMTENYLSLYDKISR